MTERREFIITRYTLERQKKWEDFIDFSTNGTIFHSQRFFAYHPPERFRHHHLFISLRGKIRALFTGAEVKTENGLELRSHPGASYGGFVIKPEADFEDYYGIVEAVVSYSRICGFKVIRLTQTPIIYYQTPHQGVEFALQAQGFSLDCCELTQSVDLTAMKEDAVESLVDKTRNAYRQAVKKGLVYEEGVELNKSNLTEFHHILTINRDGLGVKPTHTLIDLLKLSQLIPEKLHLAFVRHKSKRISGLLHFICNPKVVLLFYVCHLREYQDLKPIPFLLTHTLNWAKKQGFRELDFGISTVKGAPNRGLLKFKENFRTRPFLRITYKKALL